MQLTKFTMALHDNDKYSYNLIKIQNQLRAHSVNAYYCEHNKAEEKSKHVHIYAELKGSYDTNHICKWFDTIESMVCKVNSTVGILSYLTHINQDDKPIKYCEDDIVTVCGTKYNKRIEEEKIKIAESKQKKPRSIDSWDKGLPSWFGNFDKNNGGLPYWDQCKFVQEYFTTKPKQKAMAQKNLDDNFKSYSKIKLKETKRMVNVFFITGPAGSGKSTFAQQLLDSAHKTFCISSSSNDAFQDYMDQDAIILDDMRDSSFSFSDLLKILDNTQQSSIKSRYFNRAFLGDTIVITSTVPLYKWYMGVDKDDSRKQFYRRVNLYVECSEFVARVYEPLDNGRALDDFGKPYGSKYMPIPIVSPKQVNSLFDSLSQFGITKEKFVTMLDEKIVDEIKPCRTDTKVYHSGFVPVDDNEEIPF